MAQFALKFVLIVGLMIPVQTVLAAENRPVSSPRKQVATIVFSGLGGSVLGLSTLSFYGRPQDRLSNIAIGFAVGVIAGTIYTTYRAATRPHYAYPTESWSDLALQQPLEREFFRADGALQQEVLWPIASWQFQF